jgi:hypothetical protein
LPEELRQQADIARAPATAATAHFLAALLTAGAVLAPVAASAQRPSMRISREQLSRIAPDSTLRTGIPILGRQGQDSARLSGGMLTLSRGEFAALQTVGGVRAVPGPLTDAAPDSLRPPPNEPFYALPIRLITPDATLQGTWVLRPVYKVANRMRWNAEQQVFRGALFIAIEDSLRRSESRPLPTPVRFELLTDADSIDPNQFAFEHTNLPLRRVQLVARRVLDSLRVQLVPEFNVAGVDVWIPVEPALRVETTPRRIQGWGIGTARVVVHVLGVSPDSARSASITSSAGELDAVDVRFGRAGTATTQLRSQGGGAATLMASAPGLGDATATIDFTLPWPFLLAALLGGIAGGALAAMQERKKDAKARSGEYLLKGVLAGLIGAVAWYALGVNVLQLDLGLPRQNEFAVFGLAALIGYFGIPRVGAQQKQT